MLGSAVVLLVGTMVVGQSDALQSLRREALGDWQRQVEYNGQSQRQVKHIEDRQETLSLYAPNGDVVYQHIVDYEITLNDNWAVFSFWNLRVLVGGEESEEAEATTRDAEERFSYIFKIHENAWHEVHGLKMDMAQAPSINVYQRVTGDQAAPTTTVLQQEAVPPGKQHLQEIAFLIGTWQNVEDANDRRQYEWINNQSYIMFLSGNYREIIGWDLVHERVVSWSYGSDGGQGRGLWTKEDGQWRFLSRAFLDRWGNPMQPYSITVEQVDDHTVRFTSVSQDANGQPQYQATYTRVSRDN